MDVTKRVHRVRIDWGHVQAARFDLGQVQDIVQDRHQGGARLTDGVDHPARVRIKRMRRQGLRHAKHAIERRADLVAHVGEELALGLCGGLGGVAGGLHLSQTPGALLGELGLRCFQARTLTDQEERKRRGDQQRDRDRHRCRVDLPRLQEQHAAKQVVEWQHDRENDRGNDRGLADLCHDRPVSNHLGAHGIPTARTARC